MAELTGLLGELGCPGRVAPDPGTGAMEPRQLVTRLPELPVAGSAIVPRGAAVVLRYPFPFDVPLGELKASLRVLGVAGPAEELTGERVIGDPCGAERGEAAESGAAGGHVAVAGLPEQRGGARGVAG